MKRPIIISALMAATVLSGTPAFAEAPGQSRREAREESNRGNGNMRVPPAYRQERQEQRAEQRVERRAPAVRQQRVEARTERRVERRVERAEPSRAQAVRAQAERREAARNWAQNSREDRRDDRRDWRQERREDARNRVTTQDVRRDNDRQYRDRNDWRANDRRFRDNDRNWRNNDRNWRDNDRRNSWNREWRRDNRYDWRNYRERNRRVYRLSRYRAPYGWDYGYRRFSIGISLFSGLYGSSYWIDDPWYYRLPPAYGNLRWVRYYDDAMLVDVRTGYVVDVIYDFFW